MKKQTSTDKPAGSKIPLSAWLGAKRDREKRRKMKEKITYFTKCLKCEEITEYIMRDRNINNNIKDADVFRIIAQKVENPHITRKCEKCGILTLQLEVGWDY